MKISAILLLLFISSVCHSQNYEQIDSLINEICNLRLKNKNESKFKIGSDEYKLTQAFVENYPDSMQIGLFKKIYYAKEYSEKYQLLLKKESLRGDWERTTGQTPEQKDSLIEELCKTLASRKGQADSIRWKYAYEKHLLPIISECSEYDKYEMEWAFMVRFERKCTELRKKKKNIPTTNYFKVVTEKPKSKIDKKISEQFKELRFFYYYLPTGQKVKVKILNNSWIEYYKHGTFSACKMNWINDNEFDLEFIESDEDYRKNSLHSGEKYRYSIIEKKDDYYEILSIAPGSLDMCTFKIYY